MNVNRETSLESFPLLLGIIRTPTPSLGSMVKFALVKCAVIGTEGKPIGVLPLNEALAMARQQGVDLVEIAPNAVPPVCRAGRFRQVPL